MKRRANRRNFLMAVLAGAMGNAGCAALRQQRSHLSAVMVDQQAAVATMPTRLLGNTGVRLPILGLGGAGRTPLSWEGDRRDERSAIAIIERALALGIRYFDTAASYGPSEEYLGKVLPAQRSGVFLASKTGARDRDGAWRELERSLKRLNIDYLDLWQLHHISFHEELEQIFSSRGAIQALEEAKDQKLVRFGGITGHHEPDVIAAGLQRYPFDATLVSLNAADIHHPRPFSQTVLPAAKQQNVGVIAMKVPAYGRIFKGGVLDGMHQAMGYVLSLEGVHCCIIAAETVEQLESNVKVAKAFKPLNVSQMVAIEQRTARAWEENTFFRAWT